MSISKKFPPVGYYWWIPNDTKQKEQPVEVDSNGIVLICGSDEEVDNPDGVFIPLTSKGCRNLL